jgi:hypothetical protein
MPLGKNGKQKALQNAFQPPGDSVVGAVPLRSMSSGVLG